LPTERKKRSLEKSFYLIGMESGKKSGKGWGGVELQLTGKKSWFTITEQRGTLDGGEGKRDGVCLNPAYGGGL